MKNNLGESIINIQKNSEEKRLILGQKFEQFLYQKLIQFGDLLARVFSAKSFAFFGCVLVFAISLLVQSTSDLGHDSAAVLDISKRMLLGGKYLQDFWENNLPFFFVLNMVPHFLAKIFAIHQIIAVQIVANLVGIITIFFSAKILSRSDLVRDRTAFNLTIIGFAAAFFLRAFTLQFNEFGTKATYFVAFALPYISYHFIAEEKLNRFDQTIVGVLAALIFCLKPHYGILVIAFELHKLLTKKLLSAQFFSAIKSAFCWRNYTTLVLMVVYVLLLVKFFPDYLAAVSVFAEVYYEISYWSWLLHFLLKYDIFLPLVASLLIFLLLREQKEYWKIQPLFVALIASWLVILSEIIAGFDQRFFAYSIAIPYFAVALLLCFRCGLVSLKRNWLIILPIILLPQFDRNLFNVICDLCFFWWAFVLILRHQNQAVLASQNVRDKTLGDLALFPHNFKSWVLFSLLALVTVFVMGYGDSDFNRLLWGFCMLFSTLLILSNQLVFERIFAKQEFSRISVAVIFTTIALIFNTIMITIFSNEDSPGYQFKSPNYANDQIIKTVKSNLKAGENFLVFSQNIGGIYPVSTYLGIDSKVPFLSAGILFYPPKNSPQAGEYFLSKFVERMNSDDNRLLFFETSLLREYENCKVGLIEMYLRDPSFRAAFKRYVFSNRIVEKTKQKARVSFFADKNFYNTQGEKVVRDIEVYVRK